MGKAALLGQPPEKTITYMQVHLYYLQGFSLLFLLYQWRS